MPPRPDALQGSLALVVLQTLARQGPLHGYGITQQIQRSSTDLLRVEEGSLYPALHRMAQEGWLKSKWGRTELNRVARVYSLTPAGRRQLKLERERWQRLATGISRLLQHA